MIFIERNVLNELIKNVTVTSSFEEKVKALSVVLKSRNLILKVMNELDLDLNRKTADEVESMIRGFQDGTQIKIEINRATQRDMDLFMVSYRDSDPKLASNFVNALVRRYIEENLSLKREEAYGASRFLVDQISTFKAQAGKDRGVPSRGSARTHTSSEKGVTLYERLQELQAKKDALLVQYTENHPEVARIKAEIENLKAHMKERAGPSPGPGPGARGPGAGAGDHEEDLRGPACHPQQVRGLDAARGPGQGGRVPDHRPRRRPDEAAQPEHGPHRAACHRGRHRRGPGPA